MKTKQEIKEWLLANCINKYGILDLSELDFSDADISVDISIMRVKHNLYQCYQKVDGSLFQDNQKVKGDFYDHKLRKNQEWKNFGPCVKRVKKLKEISLEEVEELGYKLKEEIK